MINLSGAKPNDYLWDPFVVQNGLTEAALIDECLWQRFER